MLRDIYEPVRSKPVSLTYMRRSPIIEVMALRDDEEHRQVRQRRIARLRRRLGVRVAVSVLVCWHIIALAVYNMPDQNAIVKPLLHPVVFYLFGLHMDQGWTVFAPNPYGSAGYIAGAEADITYRNGEHRIWRFPQPSNTPADSLGRPIMRNGQPVHDYWLAYGKERWRKYLEVIDNSSDDYLWPPMAQYAARMNNTEPGNPPVSVQLYKYYGTVVGPGQDQPPPQRVLFDTVLIDPEDLK
jgi:hypothetical protein